MHDQPREITLALKDPAEEAIVANAMERLGWNVSLLEHLETPELAIAITESMRLLFTDSLPLVHALQRLDVLNCPSRIVLVDDNPDRVSAAYLGGADWVVPRPFDPDNPFGAI